MTVRRVTLTALVGLSTLAGFLQSSAGSAQAAVQHAYMTQTTEIPVASGAASAGPLSDVGTMAADSGHLYVSEHVEGTGEYRLDEFDGSTGAFLSQFPLLQSPLDFFFNQGVAVGHATGETEVYDVGDGSSTSEGMVAVFGAAGELQATWKGTDTPAGTFGCLGCNAGADGVAVDSSSSFGDWAAGDVYVTASAQKVVDVFRPEAGGKEKYVTQLTGISPEAPFNDPDHLAVDGVNGDVLVADGSVVDVFEPTGLGEYAFVFQITEAFGQPFSPITAMAVDGGNGEVYILEAGAIDQFSSTGAYLGQIAGTSAGPFKQATSVAVDSTTHDVFVGDRRVPEASAIDIFGPDVVVPDVTTEPASAVEAESATLNGTVNPDEAGAATCRFAWGSTSQLGSFAPCEPESVPDGGNAVAVHARLTGLQPDTAYHYRLQAGNAGGTNPGSDPQDRVFTTPGPGIHSESVTNVASSSATLEAAIDPHGTPTTYYFQYGTDTSYGSSAPASPGRAVGSGEGDVAVSWHVQELQAQTVYHYRVVAVSELAPGEVHAFAGPDRTFVTQTVGAFTLPDGRQWEMVSPPDKHGALIRQIYQGVIQSSTDGRAFSYLSDAPTEAEPQGYSNDAQSFAVRGPGGWESRDISPPHGAGTAISVGEGQQYRFFSEDLSHAAVQPFGPFDPALSSEASEATAFLRTDYLNENVEDLCSSSCYRPLVTGAPGYANVPSGTVFGVSPFNPEQPCTNFAIIICGPLFEGATPDGRSVVLTSEVPLTVPPAPQTQGLYEWSEGRLTLVSVLPDGEPVSGVLGLAVGRGAGVSVAARNAISSDGSRVIWGSGEDLYVRDTRKGETVQLDAVQGGAGGQPTARFQIASRDGSRVFFTDGARLAGGSGEGDLYECQMAEVAGKLRCDLTDLTQVHGGVPAEVGSVSGASEDGSYVYFEAPVALTPEAAAGIPNLYLWHDGTMRLVATVSPQDINDWNSDLQALTARVSPDGEWFAFMSRRSLTGYDNRDAASGQPDEEVYLYHAADGGKLACASCNPSGARPAGLEEGQMGDGTGFGGLVGGFQVWDNSTWLAANIPGWTPLDNGGARYQSRYLSDEGRLFFNSSDALVPQDVNGTEDVYEYEPPGVGHCTTADPAFSDRAGGCVDLISSGRSSRESAFLDASASGGDVFFLTSARLSRADYDSALDVYDAHECTGASPCFAPAAAQTPPCTTGDACKPSPTPQPASFGAPASATFSGAGNVTSSFPARVKAKRKADARTQKLSRALRSCRRRRGRQRVVCQRRARARYAVARGGNVKAGARGAR